MSRLEELMKELCPDGVEYKKLGECCKIETGKLNANAAEENGIYPFFTTAKEISYINTPRWDTEALLIAGNANVGDVKYYKGKFNAYQRTYVLTQFISTVDVKFLYYVLCNNLKSYLENKANTAAMTYIVLSTLEQFAIPVPPLPVQEEIVRILDTFTALTAELQARQKQYGYYRDYLLSVDGLNNLHKDFGGSKPNYRLVKLGDIATEMYRGAGIKRDEVCEEGIPCIRYGEIHTTFDIWFDQCVSHTDEEQQTSKKYADYGDILFAITSEDIENVGNCVAYLGEERIMVGGDIVVMKHNQNPKYLAYVLSTTNAVKQKGKGKVKSKVVHTSVPALQEIEIPLPSLEKQELIANILDKFHNLCTDLTAGLPAEIEGRKKQYEYYRDKLLSFTPLS